VWRHGVVLPQGRSGRNYQQYGERELMV
jgi:hypothetical protein